MIPDFQSIMLPLLKFASDNKEHSKRDAVDSLARHFKLTEDELKELLPSGRQLVFDNRVAWAKVYMTKAELLRATRRGFFAVAPLGLKILEQKPKEINIKFLDQFPKFQEFRSVKRDDKKTSSAPEKDGRQTPEELLEAGYQKMRQDLTQEILDQLKKSSPGFFERLVVELLVKMGYGGSRKDAGRAIGKSGDEGIDGIIKEDRLGLDTIYIQAKRWSDAPIGRPEIQKFVGALQGQRAKKGIFITTSGFSAEAVKYAAAIDCKIVLIDGEQLAQMMIDSDLGVSKLAVYEIKKIDSDYFLEEGLGF